MLGTDTSLSVIGVALAIPPLVQLCLSLGVSLVQLVKMYHDSGSVGSRLALKIESKWKNLETILVNIDRVSATLDVDLANEIGPMLNALSTVLMQAREKAAKVGMSSRFSEPRDAPQSERGEHGAVRRPSASRAIRICWSNSELETFIEQCEDWEAMISTRLLIIVMFHCNLFLNAPEEHRMQIPTLHGEPPMVAQRGISSRSPVTVDEIVLRSEDFEWIRVHCSMVQLLQKKNGDVTSFLAERLPLTCVPPVNRDDSSVRYPSGLHATARMLHGANPGLMNILQCAGINYDGGRFTLLYTVPQQFSQPRSLRDLLTTAEARKKKDGSLLLALNHRVRLAIHVATAVLYVHSGHLVHKNIKPENIIIFESNNDRKFPGALGRPFLVGFDRSRLESGDTSGDGDTIIGDSLYRHPERWGVHLEHKFTLLHDIYSLGVVLFEIGLWKSFVHWKPNSFERSISWKGLIDLFPEGQLGRGQTPYDVRNRLVLKAEELLPPKMGQRYTDVVVACLSGNMDFGVAAREEQGEARLGLAYIKSVMSNLEKICV